MFGFIKKKLSSFVESIANKKREQEEEPKLPIEQPRLTQEEKPIQQEPAIEEHPAQAEQPILQTHIEEQPIPEPIQELPVTKPTEELKPAAQPAIQKEITPAPLLEPVDVEPVRVPAPIRPQPVITTSEEAPALVEKEEVVAKEIAREANEFLEAEEAPVKKKELKPKLGFLSKIKGVLSGSVTIQESEVNPVLEELEIALLENDVSFDTAAFLVEDLRKRLIGKKVPRGNVGGAVTDCVRGALQDLLKSEPFDLVARVKTKKPFVILFIGPNGSGKTTTMAKMSHYLKKRGLKSVIAASDTFRAAAIHQAVEHGEKLGVRVIKHDYGADPSAVAFDAIEHAKANKIDVVLVDTAGRQETNYNLVREMEKINRVVKPDLKIFVGEAIAGHALIEQVKKMGEAVNGLDGIILTKLDCDAKGGASLSVAHEAKVPVLYICTGQEYEDFQPFDSEWFVERMLPENN